MNATKSEILLVTKQIDTMVNNLVVVNRLDLAEKTLCDLMNEMPHMDSICGYIFISSLCTNIIDIKDISVIKRLWLEFMPIPSPQTEDLHNSILSRINSAIIRLSELL